MPKKEKAADKQNGSKKGAASAPLAMSASGIDLETVRQLAKIAGEYGLAEIEVDPSGHVRVRRDGGGAGGEPIATIAPARHAAPAIALAPAAAPAAADKPAEPGTFVTSPFVGTFYRAPSPDAGNFVEVGQAVRKGQVVCIVEAMKLMNEIEAEAEGKIVEVLVQNGEHVEYGQHLFRIAKS